MIEYHPALANTHTIHITIAIFKTAVAKKKKKKKKKKEIIIKTDADDGKFMNLGSTHAHTFL